MNAMLALVCTAVFITAAALAVIAIVVTMQGRTAQVKALLAEYRTLQRDREFLVQITSHSAPAPLKPFGLQVRRNMRRSMRPVAEVARTTLPLRVAA